MNKVKWFKNKWLTVWVLSILLFIASACFFAIFAINDRAYPSYLITGEAAIAMASVLYILSNKRLKFPEGYTVIQAMIFYQKCLKIGITSAKAAETDERSMDILNEVLGEKHKKVSLSLIFGRGKSYFRE